MSVDTVTTVLGPARTYDLTDLTTAKDELSIPAADTSNDTKLSRAITQVSKAVMNDTNRIFAPETVRDVFDIGRTRSQAPSGVRELQLSRWPVLAITSVVQTPQTVGATTALVQDVDFRADLDTGRLLRLDATTGRETAWEPVPTTVTYAGGFGAAVTETHSVPAISPYTVTVAQASTFSCDRLVSYANGTALTRVASGPAAGQYSVAAGVYTFNAADLSQALTFAYCTGAVPDDLADATLRLVTARYKGSGRDPALILRETPGVGTERYWFGGAPGQSGPFPPDIEGLLDNYRVPVVA